MQDIEDVELFLTIILQFAEIFMAERLLLGYLLLDVRVVWVVLQFGVLKDPLQHSRIDLVLLCKPGVKPLVAEVIHWVMQVGDLDLTSTAGIDAQDFTVVQLLALLLVHEALDTLLLERSSDNSQLALF